MTDPALDPDALRSLAEAAPAQAAINIRPIARPDRHLATAPNPGTAGLLATRLVRRVASG